MRPAIFFAAAIGLISCGTHISRADDLITDSSGQKVEAAVDAEISAARLMRMPQMGRLDIDGAISALTKIVADHPNYYRAWFNLGLSYYEKGPGDLQPAINALERADAIQTSNPDIVDGSLYNTLGYIFLNSGIYTNAEKYLRKGLALKNRNSDWTNSSLLYNLGRVEFETQNYKQAELFLGDAIVEFNNPAAVQLKQIVDIAASGGSNNGR